MSSVLIVAAETSSCLYAQRLLEHWRANNKQVKAFGIGNQAMVNLGFEAIGRSEELAVVGVSEIIKHWGKIKEAFNGLISEAEKRKPDFILLMDYPEFNFKLARKLKERGFKVVYYISPQLWAWRKSRIKLVKKYIDQMLVLFPFEVDFYKKHGVDVEWVGHPLVDELSAKYFEQESVSFLRGKFGIRPGEHVLGLMPGSRKSELKHHFELQLAVAKKLSEEIKNLRVVILVAPDFAADDLKVWVKDSNLSLVFAKDEPFNMISLCDTILVASGTATLMVGLLQKPMVIMYRMSSLSAQIAKWFVKDTPFFGMVNLVVGKKISEELFQEQASVQNLVAELKKLILNNDQRNVTIENLKQVRKVLGHTGATKNVAVALERFFAQP
jgi:lipid-A-disaccharide synthase